MSRFISLSSTSRILCIGHFLGELQCNVGSSRNKRGGGEQIRPSPARDQRHSDREAAAFSKLALDRDLTAHQPAKFLAERQSKPSAAVLAGAGVVSDGEFLKEIRDQIWSDTDSRIDHVDDEFLTRRTMLTFGDQFNFAVLRELRCVIEQLSGHILEPARVAQGRAEV